MKQTITIKKVTYNVAFNYSTIRYLATLWGFKLPSQVDKKILKVVNKPKPKKNAKEPELTFEEIDTLRDLFYAALVVANDTVEITAEQLINTMLFEDKEAFSQFTQQYINSLAVQKESTNPNARPDQKKQ